MFYEEIIIVIFNLTALINCIFFLGKCEKKSILRSLVTQGIKKS